MSKTVPLTLEVIASSFPDALEAARGGAHRLEIVRDLHRQGLTPSIDLVRQIQREVPLPLRVMVRESDAFACGSDDECRRLVDAAAALDALGVDGIVVGWTRGDRIDEETLGCVLDAAPSLRATFHRAFDALPDPEAALRMLQQYSQIDHVLTGAGTGPWPLRCATLSRYARWAGPRMERAERSEPATRRASEASSSEGPEGTGAERRPRAPITILPGGEIDEEAIRALAACGCVTEVHVGRAARTARAVDGSVSAEAVRALRRAAGWND